MSLIMLALVYFAFVTTTGLIVLLLGHDLLCHLLILQAESYWVAQDQSVGSMKTNCDEVTKCRSWSNF